MMLTLVIAVIAVILVAVVVMASTPAATADVPDASKEKQAALKARLREGQDERQGIRRYPVGLVGESHCQEAIRSCRKGQRVQVLHEIGNPYDEQALVVVTETGEKLGYIPLSSWLRGAVHDEEKGCTASIRSTAAGERGRGGAVIEVKLNEEGVEQCAYRP
jgi:hypothetical protein